MEGVTNVSIEAGDKPGTQKVLVTTDGSAKLKKGDAEDALDKFNGKYDVKDWDEMGSESGSEEEMKEEESNAPKLLAESQEWTSAGGSSITAAIQRVDASTGMIHFLKEDGTVMKVHGSKLSDDSKAKIRELMAGQ